jgi:hypothetical protein
MTRKVTVKPKSSKSKNRLINTMGNNPVCIVEQDKGDGMLFLASQNQKYFFWVNISEDCHWECDWEIV